MYTAQQGFLDIPISTMSIIDGACLSMGLHTGTCSGFMRIAKIKTSHNDPKGGEDQSLTISIISSSSEESAPLLSFSASEVTSFMSLLLVGISLFISTR